MRTAILAALIVLLAWIWETDFGGVIGECRYQSDRFHTAATYKVGFTNCHCEFNMNEVRENIRRLSTK